jgi:hypothetical protein
MLREGWNQTKSLLMMSLAPDLAANLCLKLPASFKQSFREYYVRYMIQRGKMGFISPLAGVWWGAKPKLNENKIAISVGDAGGSGRFFAAESRPGP